MDIKKILNGPLDPELANEKVGLLQEEVTNKTSEVLTAAIGVVDVAHVLVLVNLRTGLTTIASNINSARIGDVLRDTAEALDRQRDVPPCPGCGRRHE